MTLTVTPGAGATMLTDDIAGVKSAVAKLQIGAAGVDGGLISTTNGLPSNIAQVGGSALAMGQNIAASSIPVALSGPQVARAAAFSRPANATAYSAGQLYANSTVAGSVSMITFGICPANGIPVHILKGKILMASSAITGVVITNGIFQLHLYGQQPASISNGDGGTFVTSNINWAGTMDCTLLDQGLDYSVGELTPTFGSSVYVTPASNSTIVYGLIQVRAAFAPQSSQVAIVEIMAQ